MCHNELKLKLDVHLFGELNLNLNFRKPDPLISYISVEGTVEYGRSVGFPLIK